MNPIIAIPNLDYPEVAVEANCPDIYTAEPVSDRRTTAVLVVGYSQYSNRETCFPIPD